MSQPKQNIAKRSYSWFRKFQYNPNRDTPSDARNVLLVVVALIAAVTFQAGVNPPGGVWQDNGNGTLVAENGTLVAGNGTHVAGTAIYASQPASVPFVTRCLGYFFKKYCVSENESTQIGRKEDGAKRDKKDGQAGQQV
ncbi:hypothetical protein NC653_032489 [Populus alba x Populus x berolinensis]|uniref:PGG domain-containing protein n=1 Tax=Populus alba x Populus x berolinensis TaxID=444605 RepID=A0AAD6LRK4_9ROSI|nr:hypothetical protein NC653_032489 [Populus alba x Populus x berolinensis]